MSTLRAIEIFQAKKQQARPAPSTDQAAQTCRDCEHWKPTLGPNSGLGVCHNLAAGQARFQDCMRPGCRGFFRAEGGA